MDGQQELRLADLKDGLGYGHPDTAIFDFGGIAGDANGGGWAKDVAVGYIELGTVPGAADRRAVQ